MIYFYLGGAGSGKNGLAEAQALSLSKSPWYLATAKPVEEGRRSRQKTRQLHPAFQQISEPLDLTGTLTRLSRQRSVVLVDCLTVWLSNHLLHKSSGWDETRSRFLAFLKRCPSDVILISNEIGQGIVPMGRETRRFVDEAGWLHQEIATVADRSWFVVAGRKIDLQGKR